MASILANNKEESVKKNRKEIEAISEKIKASKLNPRDIIVPLSVSVILIMLGIFVFVPMVKSALSFRAEYKDIREKEKTLESLEKELKKIDEGTFQVDLINSKEVIPKTLQVSSFMYYIDTLANEKRLVSKSISAGDIQVSMSNKSDDKKSSYLGVSGPLSYTGSLSKILEFLDTLYSASPYIISADNVSLKKSGDEWRVTLNVTGYYVPDEVKVVDPYATFVLYTKHQGVIDIFAKKAEKLK